MVVRGSAGATKVFPTVLALRGAGVAAVLPDPTFAPEALALPKVLSARTTEIQPSGLPRLIRLLSPPTGPGAVRVKLALSDHAEVLG